MAETRDPTPGVINCARCGQDHDCEWKRMERPVRIGDHVAEWWALCVNTQDPILFGGAGV